MFQLSNLLKNSIGWLDSSGQLSDFVLSSRVRLARNLANGRFPPAAGAKELRLVIDHAFRVARKTKELSKAAYVRLEDLDKVDQHFLVERHLVSADLLHRPQSSAVIIGDRELLSVMVNEEDHLRIQTLVPGLDLRGALETAAGLDRALGAELPYAFHNEFGYLTSCPTNVGTGLRASCLVHLPGLVQSQAIAPVFQELSRVGLVVRGFYGEGSQVYGDLFQISNATSIGKSEGELTQTIENILKNVIAHEAQMREKLLKGAARVKTTDRIWRAYAKLAYSRLISYEETMQELSLLRMGLAARFDIDHVSMAKVNELIILTQPAHIQMQAGREIRAQERDERRAALIRQGIVGRM
ncbi:MAG: protein arginine kinase [Elusimicrobia bacterium]|nr:protein arginine kinase [Elusimicrobiota bacterium]